MQPFEINKIVRDAGFTPLGLPQRKGTTYVLRAIDSRDILMRVVIDARSGAIRAVNRIVAARPDVGWHDAARAAASRAATAAPRGVASRTTSRAAAWIAAS
jgi:hypothetical protein